LLNSKFVQTITVTLDKNTVLEQTTGTMVKALLPSPNGNNGLPSLGAMINNDVSSLTYPLSVNSRVRFLTRADPHGWRIYRRSLSFLVAKAVHDAFPDALLTLEHSIGTGLYCTFKNGSQEGITAAQVQRLREHIQDLIDKDYPIERRKVAYEDAVREFETSGQQDKFALLIQRNPPHVVVYECDGFTDLAHGPLAPSTGTLNTFDLIHYPPGFVIHLPSRESPFELTPFEDQPHLFQIYKEHKEWGRILGVTTVGTLNEIIEKNEVDHFIRTAEALHEKKLGHIADAISAARDRIRLILIAGPSCAGKTTFAKRLSTHLRVTGLRPVTISTDNYFLEPDRNPTDENGVPDFEHLEAVDLEQFNEDLSHLVTGETVEIPTFNFVTKQREYTGRSLTLADDQILIVEGIHALNPRLTQAIPHDRKYRIFISALTQLNVDSNNRISTTDNRLMRRLVRDHRYRGHSALDTLELWPSVRRGEKRWIFPFQGEADATFNSALDYELAVLKSKVEPLLTHIKPTRPEYCEARRLSEFLLNFLPTDDRPVPRASILREYIGGSAFRY
jgi:uridine kinase